VNGCCMGLQLCNMFELHMVAILASIFYLQIKHADMLHTLCTPELSFVISGRVTEYRCPAV
jgi:hypothetical protein